MRRPTLLILVVMTLAIAVAAVIQLNQSSPLAPFAGPSAAGELPGTLRFLPSPGWTTFDSGGPLEDGSGAQQAIALAGSVDPAPILAAADRDGDATLDVLTDPLPSGSMAVDAIVLSAAIVDPGTAPAEPSPEYPAAALPLSLRDSCRSGGREGAPADPLQCRVGATVAGRRIEVRAYLGDDSSLQEAERQLWRLVVPPLVPATG